MTRPQIIRADTIDLQNRHAPSAQDHSQQPSHPAAIGAGPPAPHQAEAQQKYVEEQEQYGNGAWQDDDQNQEQYDNSNQSYNGGQHILASQNGPISGGDGDMGDDADDDSMDEDDMMDKISSSPSIDDGGCSLGPRWPSRSTSLACGSSMIGSQVSFATYRDIPRTPSPKLPGFLTPSPRTPKFITPSTGGSIPSSPPIYLFRDPVPSVPDSVGMQVPRGLSRSESPLSNLSLVANRNSNSSPWEESSSTVLPGQVESYDSDLDVRSEDSWSADPFAEHAERDRESSSELSFIEQIAGTHHEDQNPGEGDERPLVFPYESDSEFDSDESDDYFVIPDDPRYFESAWAAECLQTLEDIDFEFVYALHTFVATVEGQANATKGDTMVLLDDSNSYWWLVRVVKDSSIGYLPAEHIETPTERLARLNKHRNIDLSAAMLGDQAEKPKNILATALKKRKAKNVTFNSTHNYVEASDVEYSSDEDEESYMHDDSIDQIETAEDEVTVSEPERAGVREVTDGITDDNEQSTLRASEDSFDGTGRLRNGTVRNTDSFYKDDSVETRKITITPNLLRDDSVVSRPSVEVTPNKGRVSLDKREDVHVADKPKDKKGGKDKKKEEKEKKPGMLSGLFKRKDKKRNLDDEDPEELIMGRKSSTDRASSPEKHSLDRTISEDSQETSVLQGRDMSGSTGSSPQRQPSKLQKKNSGVGSLQSVDESRPLDTSNSEIRLVQPDQDGGAVRPLQVRPRAPSVGENPARTSTDSVASGSTTASKPSSILHCTRSNSEATQDSVGVEKVKRARDRDVIDEDSDSGVGEMQIDRSAPAVDPVEGEKLERPIPGQFPDSCATTNTQASGASTDAVRHVENELASPTYTAYRPPQRSQPPPQAPAQAQSQPHRQGSNRQEGVNSFEDPFEQEEQHGHGAYEDHSQTTYQHGERLSESPIEITFNQSGPNNPPQLVRGRGSGSEDESRSPTSSPSPELVNRSDANHAASDSTHLGANLSMQNSLSLGSEKGDTWNDSFLRNFFDDGDEVRDLLVLVYDKNNVEPAGLEHPVIGGLFRREERALIDMRNRLDNMLGDWLARKRSSGGPR